MKDHIRIILVTALLLAVMPLAGTVYRQHTAVPAKSASSGSTAETVPILFEDTGEVRQLSMHDYIVGAVFAQMPADFDPEALKAQAVLAATYARSMTESEKASPTEALKGAVISTDKSKYQAYFTPQQAKALYGSDYPDALERISSAADYAESLTLCYEGRPIIVAFHGISCGSTESAWDMWGRDIPYLCAVSSSDDADRPECRTEVVIPEEKLKDLIADEYGITPEGPPGEWLSPAETTANGTVLLVSICGNTFPADAFCELCGLPSQHFEVTFSDGSFTFSSMGCGHLVGMSQYGADSMAKQGADCPEILLHYFPKTQLIRSYDPH